MSKSQHTLQIVSHPLQDLGNTMMSLLKSDVGAMLLMCVAFLIFMSVFDKQNKGKLAQGRFGGRWEKWSAVRLAYRQVHEQKHNQVTLWAGTPRELKAQNFHLRKIWVEIRTLLLNSPPTLHLGQAQQGIIVCGAPNSGKTYSIIDPCIRAAVHQEIPCVVYDYKGDQLKAHAAYAASQGYDVSVFAPGYAYSSVINPLDFLSDEGDSLMARQLAITINRNAQRFGSVSPSEEKNENRGTLFWMRWSDDPGRRKSVERACPSNCQNPVPGCRQKSDDELGRN